MAKISKKQAKDKIDQFESIDEFDEIELSNKKTKLSIVETKKDNMKKNNFENIVLEFISEQRDFNKEIKSRLDVLEQDMKEVKKDIKDIQNCPTIKKELKETKK